MSDEKPKGIPADLIRRMPETPLRNSIEAVVAAADQQGLTLVAYGEKGSGATLGVFYKVGKDFTFVGELTHQKGNWGGGAGLVWTPDFL